MANQSKVCRYAAALYNVAVKKEDVNEMSSRLNYLRSACKAVPELNQLLLTHRVPTEDKIKILKSVLGDSISELEFEFVSHLLEDGHFILYPEIVKRIQFLVDSDSSIINVKITSPQSISDEEINKIQNEIEGQLHKSVIMQTEIDPALLGGIKLRVGNTLIDSSVSAQLEKLENSLLQV